MPSQFKLSVPDGLGELIESLAHAILQNKSSTKQIPEDHLIYQAAYEHFNKLLEIRNEAQSGLSPSSTEEYTTTKAPIVTQAGGDRKASEGEVSTDRPPEEPESNDTSYGVEATAIRTLAASTGTVAILGTTAKTAGKDSNNDEEEEEREIAAHELPKAGGTSEDTEAEAKKEDIVETAVNKSEDETISSVDVDEGVKIVEELNKIVDAESAQTELSLLQETTNNNGTDNDNSVSSGNESRDEQKESTLESHSEPTQNPTVITVDDSISNADISERQLNDSEMQAEIEADISAHSRTHEEDDNDISSEQLKTNSLSDVSMSEMDERPESIVKKEVTSVKTTDDEPQETPSEVEVTEKPSLVKVISDERKETFPREKSESPTDQTNVQEENTILNAAATTIQSTFRGYQTRKILQIENDDSERVENPKLTDSLIENVRATVDDIIKEAEVKTESLINSPVTDEFPAPPEDMLLEARNGDQESKMENVDDVATAKASSFDSNEGSDAKHIHRNSTASELARMTADEDLPAPDFEMLESSSTDDINTEIMNNSLKGTEDELRDSTEGDLTLDENSEKVKETSKTQEYSELKQSPSVVSEIQPEHTPSQDTTSSLLSQDLLEDDNAQVYSNGRVEDTVNSIDSNHEQNETQSDSVQKASLPSNGGESLKTISTDESVPTYEHSNNASDANSSNNNASEGPVHGSANDFSLSDENPALDSPTHAPNVNDVAATKIQAHVRGYLARKQIDSEVKTDLAGKVDDVELEQHHLIPTTVENFGVAKNQTNNGQMNCEANGSKTNGSDSEEIPEDRTKRKLDNDTAANNVKGEETQSDSADENKLMNNSAAKIQAGVRGFLVRKRQKTLKESPREDSKPEEMSVRN